MKTPYYFSSFCGVVFLADLMSVHCTEIILDDIRIFLKSKLFLRPDTGFFFHLCTVG